MIVPRDLPVHYSCVVFDSEGAFHYNARFIIMLISLGCLNERYNEVAVYYQIKSNQTNYFIVHLKVDQRAGQLSLPHLGITKTEKNRTKTLNRRANKSGERSRAMRSVRQTETD